MEEDGKRRGDLFDTALNNVAVNTLDRCKVDGIVDFNAVREYLEESRVPSIRALRDLKAQ